MKKIILLLLTLSLFTLYGCTKEGTDKDTSVQEKESTATTEEPTNDVDSAENTSAVDYSCYDELIKKVSDGLKNGTLSEDIENLDISTVFCYPYLENDTRGYLIQDLDGNGINELIFGSTNTDAPNYEIYDIYTIKDGQMIHTVKGWERNIYYLCKDGVLANYGSGGASLHTSSYYTYTGQIIDLEQPDGLIESLIYDGDRDSENPWFYSTTKVYDEAAEPISVEEVNEIMSCYEYETLEFTSF